MAQPDACDVTCADIIHSNDRIYVCVAGTWWFKKLSLNQTTIQTRAPTSNQLKMKKKKMKLISSNRILTEM